MNSKRKGADGERDLAKFLQKHGQAEAKRGQQYCGLQGNADVIGVAGIHIECKRAEQVRDEVFLKQAERDARQGEIPTVWYRRNHEDWKTLMRSEVFLLIWDELTDEQKANISKKVAVCGQNQKNNIVK